jgi:predicted house-cleaning noncanonical NTP pyrophosphatase (MazG superfamily)
MTFSQHINADDPTASEYPKLIRDKIPEIIHAKGEEVETRTLGDDEFLQFLLKKVVEEARELANTTNESDLLEEIADVREVIDAMLELKGISANQINAIQDAKRHKRGGFKLRLLMLHNS